MKEQYSSLFTPWKIGNCEIKNRFVMTSMGGTSLFGWMEVFGNHFDKEAANFILERCKNNVGLILPGIAPIRDIIGGNNNNYIRRERFFGELKRSFYIGIKKDTDIKAIYNDSILIISFPKMDIKSNLEKNIKIN